MRTDLKVALAVNLNESELFAKDVDLQCKIREGKMQKKSADEVEAKQRLLRYLHNERSVECGVRSRGINLDLDGVLLQGRAAGCWALGT